MTISTRQPRSVERQRFTEPMHRIELLEHDADQNDREHVRVERELKKEIQQLRRAIIGAGLTLAGTMVGLVANLISGRL